MLVDRLLLFCISHDVVAEDDIPMLRYCIEKRLYTILTFIPLLVVGIPIAGVLTTVSFLATFIYLRQMTNGYHAKTHGRCLMSSLFLEIIILEFSKCNQPLFVRVSMTVASSIIIWKLSPYNHPNMHYSNDEILVFRINSRKRLVITIITMCLFYCFSEISIVNGMCFGIVLAATLLGFAHIINCGRKSDSGFREEI